VVAITDEEQRWQESLKLEYDWHKNMITLSAGIPIVIAALVSSDFFPNKLSDMSWLIWSLGLLAGSILCSLLSMIIVARFMRLGQMKTGTRRFFGYRALTMIYSMGCFLGGIILFVWFAIRNF
jgi:hypothetical protein